MTATIGNPKSSPIHLRVFRHLDQERISQALVDSLEKNEKTTEWIDGDRARDYAFTEEIMQITDGYAIVDPDMNILARYPTLKQAEAARGSARVVFNLELDRSDAEDE